MFFLLLLFIKFKNIMKDDNVWGPSSYTRPVIKKKHMLIHM
ncbi:hypothetical protein HMPREF9189_0913 [Streptococcus sp. oral taxon 071 str. 73H25AP]|nr:hypothetical protein HMPREF9189_0913 [Streptococcus sp. oral taxon 071 str. 73H25AP]